MAADGRIVDLGSFRGSAATIAEFFQTGVAGDRDRESGDWTAFLREDYDYGRFYLGTLYVSGRADLSPVYQLIFERLKAAGGDWRYSHPRLGMVSFRPSQADVLRADPEHYDPSAVLAAEQEDAAHEEETAALQRDLDESYARSIREARQCPPPFTVAAYQSVFGRFPEGWPPPL